MNDSTNLQEMTGTDTLLWQNAPALSAYGTADIVLGSNQDFETALKHVMQVAQSGESTNVPRRISIEIQTPPGAIVNVYVSRQNDQWRAQLGTNDPQALKWVQNQMEALRQTGGLGAEVTWLPPQMETNAGQNPNFTGNQGREGRPDQEAQQEKRASRNRLSAPENSFMNTINELGRAA